MEKFLIVDGSNLLFQMFYGMPARIINSRGKAIQGTLGFVGALLKIIRMVHPSHVAVVFDGECENERKTLDDTYKANRPDYSMMPEEDTPFSQLPDIYAALDVLGICHRETETCEADDWIAGFVREYGEKAHIVIASQDSDFFQLISENVRILRYRGKNTVLADSGYIRERLGIAPEQYADYKSMVGDTADNIKGAPKIGPKTAAELLGQFATLEDILGNVENVRKPSIQNSLKENAEKLRLNYRLIRLEGARELPFTMEEMEFRDPGLTTTQVLTAINLR